MTFHEDLVSGLSAVYNTAGVAAVFTPAGEDPVTVALNVILDYRVDWEPSSQVQVADDHIEIQYQRADIDRRVLKGETFTVGSATYTVRSMASYPEAFNDLEGHAVVVKS